MDHGGVGASDPGSLPVPPDGGGRFSASLRTEGGVAVITLHGELDQDTAPPLRALLAEAEEAGPARIVLDCAGLGFCDSTGLNLMLGARLRGEPERRTIELAALGPTVARMFDVTGVTAVFTVHPSLDAALAGS